MIPAALDAEPHVVIQGRPVQSLALQYPLDVGCKGRLELVPVVAVVPEQRNLNAAAQERVSVSAILEQPLLSLAGRGEHPGDMRRDALQHDQELPYHVLA